MNISHVICSSSGAPESVYNNEEQLREDHPEWVGEDGKLVFFHTNHNGKSTMILPVENMDKMEVMPHSD